MKTIAVLAVGIFMAVASCAASQAGVLVSPSLAYSPSGFQDNSTNYSRMIDQSGLSNNFVDGFSDAEEFLSLSPTHANYVSGVSWVSPWNGGAGTASVAFIFSSSITIDRVIVWNAGTGYAISGFDLYTSPDGNNFTYLAMFSLAQGDFAQVCSFPAIEMLGFRFQTTGVYSNRIGIGEVVAVSVPEPSVGMLVVGSLLCLAFFRIPRTS